MFDYLPQKILNAISKYNVNSITEIRLRVDKPIHIQIDGVYRKIPQSVADFSGFDAENLISKLTKRSLYAYTDSIKQGYLCGENGERIGLCGKCVYDDDKLLSVKDFNSFCIRIPHEVIGCADVLLKTCFVCGVKSVLVISPPGGGKTTFLRDAVRVISRNFKSNILVIDEKNELYANGRFNLGETSDVISSGRKNWGFNVGVVNMRPDVIVTDELSSEKDIKSAENAVLSGIYLLASAHASSISELKKKTIFKNLFENGIFDYAVILSSQNKLGEVKEIIEL